MAESDAIKSTIRQFILTEYLPGEDPSELTNDTPMVSSGILDSLAILKLITFLESTFEIEVEAHEADEDHLNTLDDIVNLVLSKR